MSTLLIQCKNLPFIVDFGQSNSLTIHSFVRSNGMQYSLLVIWMYVRVVLVFNVSNASTKFNFSKFCRNLLLYLHPLTLCIFALCIGNWYSYQNLKEYLHAHQEREREEIDVRKDTTNRKSIKFKMQTDKWCFCASCYLKWMGNSLYRIDEKKKPDSFLVFCHIFVAATAAVA